MFAGYHYHTHPLKSLVAATDAAGKLNSIHSELVRALNGLPQAFTLERQDTQELLTHLALCWKETGNALFKNQSISGAIEAYKKALEIYNLADFIGQHGSQETPLYSNLAVCYLSEKRYRESIASANTCLEIAARCADESVPSTLKEKLVFNLLKAMCRQAQEFLTIPTRKEFVPSLHLETKQLMEKHGDILSSGNYELLSTSIAEMEHQLAFLGQTTSLDSPRGVPAGAGATASAAKDSASKTEDASALRVLGQFAVKPKLPAQPQATQSCTLL